MHYVMSDIHGCYDQYRALLKKINFCDTDMLYILGDVIDRGPRSIDVLMDMSMRANVIPILGNHEYMALMVLPKLSQEITSENIECVLTSELLKAYGLWERDGGDITVRQFRKLDKEMQESLIDYLREFELYEHLVVNGKEYVLVHAGLENFSPDRPLDTYRPEELIFQKTDYAKVYYEDKCLVTGHVPNFLIDPGCKDRIIKKNNHIAVDCGCFVGKSLGVYCLETGEASYIDCERDNH